MGPEVRRVKQQVGEWSGGRAGEVDFDLRTGRGTVEGVGGGFPDVEGDVGAGFRAVAEDVFAVKLQDFRAALLQPGFGIGHA